MPTVLRRGPYRIFFYSADNVEPPHVHVQRDASSAKFWLDPVRLERSKGFSASEIRRIEAMIEERKVPLLTAWDEYFGN